MKILHLLNSGSHPYHYCEMLRRKGVDAELFTPEYHLKSHPLWEIVDTDVEEIEEEESYDYYPRQWINDHRNLVPDWVDLMPQDDVSGDPRENFTSPGFNLELLRRLRSKDIDLVHAWSLYGVVWAYLSGHRYVYATTGQLDWNMPRRMDPSIKKYIYRFVVDRAVNNAEAVISGPRLSGKIGEVYPNVERFTPRHVIDTEYFSPQDTDQPPYGDPSSEMLFFTGTRHMWDIKRNDYVLRALAEADLPDFELVAVDWGPDVDRTKELVSELGLEDSVTFVPMMSRPRLRKMLSAADAVFDSFVRGFGTSGTQALACGAPLISAANFDDDLFGSDDSGYGAMTKPPILEAYSPKDIREHVEELVDPERREEAGRRSREWVEESYSWEDGIQDHIDIYEDVLS